MMHRFRSSGASFMASEAVPRLKKKALNSLAAVQDTFLSTKDLFERHRVIFTVGTSLASVATAMFGYSLRHYHDMQVNKRLGSIEEAVKNNYELEHTELRKMVKSGSISSPACVATAGTALIIGYGLGWRGGRWYVNRQFRREQMKLMGQIMPKRWQLLGKIKPLTRFRAREVSEKTCQKTLKEAPRIKSPAEAPQSCSIEPKI